VVVVKVGVDVLAGSREDDAGSEDLAVGFTGSVGTCGRLGLCGACRMETSLASHELHRLDASHVGYPDFH
jgi:hypothetical protein